MAYETFSRDISEGWELRLRKYVSHRRLTYKDLMTSLGVSKGTATNLLSGRHKPSKNVADKMASAFTDLDINWLLFGEDSQSQKPNSVTHSVTPHTYKSGVTEYNTTAIQPPPPPPPPPPGTSNEEILGMLEQFRQRIETQDNTIAFLQTLVGQLTEQNKMLTELIKMGKFNAVTFTGPQVAPLYSLYDGNSVTLAVTAERIAA